MDNPTLLVGDVATRRVTGATCLVIGVLGVCEHCAISPTPHMQYEIFDPQTGWSAYVYGEDLVA